MPQVKPNPSHKPQTQDLRHDSQQNPEGPWRRAGTESKTAVDVEEVPPGALGCPRVHRFHNNRGVDKGLAGYRPVICHGTCDAPRALRRKHNESSRSLDAPGRTQSKRRRRWVPARQEVLADGSRYEVLQSRRSAWPASPGMSKNRPPTRRFDSNSQFHSSEEIARA